MPANKPVDALDYLDRAEKYPQRPVCAVFGDESYLRRQSLLKLRGAILGGEDADFSLTIVSGDAADLRDVLAELRTTAMFAAKRLVLVENAGKFVSRFRAELEQYVSHPSLTGVLVLDLDSFPANTRLYKMISAEGLLINCNAPSEARMTKWLVHSADKVHHLHLSASAAETLVELVGAELGLLEQELAKLALSVGEKKRVTPEIVRRFVGSWRVKSTWDMLDAALEGNVPGALRQLDLLLSSGEQPVGILAQISASLRRFAAATRLVLQGEQTGHRRIPLAHALEQAGVKAFVLKKAETQLRRLGRHRGAQLYQWLLCADMDLKGASAMHPRVILEQLITRISASQELLGVK
ncbi:MAG: DNA polymerase III subunit delta [Thermoguttaceae bacterium]